MPAKLLAPGIKEDFYPAEAKRLMQEGIVVVHACIDAEGRVQASIKTSSGFPLLDNAAQRSMQNGKWQSATRRGRPFASCHDMKVKFDLGPKLHQAQGGGPDAAPVSEEQAPIKPGP